MNYQAKEARDESGALIVTFAFANGKEVALVAKDFPSGKAMVEEAIKRAT